MNNRTEGSALGLSNMPDDQLTIESLRRWSQILLWVSVILPVLGGLAAGSRYYVERKEKQISSRVTSISIQNARGEAIAARKDLDDFKQQTAPRRLSDRQRSNIMEKAGQLKGLPIVVACRLMDGESCDFAADLVTTLREAGSVVPNLVSTSLNDLPGYIAVCVTANGNPGHAKLVADTLISGGLNVKLEAVQQNSLGAWQLGSIYIIVGRKQP